MATDADIPLPVNEAREEQVGLPIVEGEHFSKSPLTDEVANNIAPNVSKLVEKTFAEESQQNAEESNSKDGDGYRGVVPEKRSTDPSVVTSDMKVGDTDDDPCSDGAIAVTQLSKETSSDHHGTYDSTTKNVSLTKEILLESSLPSKEAESHTPCISEGDHKAPKLAEKSEESSPVQVENLQVVCDEHFEEESERLPLTEVSTGVTNENVVLEATDNAKDKDKDLKEEQSRNEVSDLSKENSVEAPPEVQSRNETLHGDTTKAEEATINADDGQKESVEGFPPIVSSSHKEGSINADLQEATGDHKDGKISDEVDNHKEVLENLSSGEGHCKVTNISPDISKDTEKTDQTVRDGSDTFVDRPVELTTTEETHVKVIQRNAEEYNSTDKDGGRDVIPEVCSIDSSVATSETKVGDTLVYPDVDDTEVATKLPKDTSSDHHGTNDSSTTDVALTEEILQEADLASRETESHTPCISEAEEPNFQVKTTDNKFVDEKPTEEDIPCIIRNEVPKEGKSDHNKITSEQDELENERSVENSTSGETIIALENSNANELQSKSDLNSSLSKEEETDLQKSVEPVTTPEDYGVPSEKTLSESHGDVECKSKTMEDAPTDHSDPKLAEKCEESSVVQVTNSQIDHNEHLGEDREGLSLKEVSTGCTNDNASAATGEIKGQSEDHKEAELPENEQSTKCTLVKEDMQIENLAESLHVALENNEVSNITQGNNIEVLPEEATVDVAEGQKDSHENFPPIVSGSPEEGSVNAVLQEVTSDDTDDKIIHEPDKHKEASENLSTTVSTEDTEGISLVKMEGSENKKEDDSAEESEEPPLPLLLAREISDASVQEARFEDGEPNKAEFYNDERDTESFLAKKENTEDVHVKPEDTKAPDLVDKRSEGGTVDAAAEREETIENVPTIVTDENTEEHLDEENEQVSSTKEPSGTELFEKDKNSESVWLTEEVQSEIPAENIKTSDFDQHTKEKDILEEKIPTEISQRIPSDEEEETRIDAATTNEKTQELQNVLNENSDNDLLLKVAASEMTHDINLEEEPERPPLTEISKKEACENESILLEPKISDEPSTVEFPKDEKSTDYTTPKKENLQPEDHKTSTSSGDIETSCSLEEQSLEDNSQTIISDKITDAGEADKNDLALENVAKETPRKDIEESLVTQVDCSAREHEEHVEEENQSSSLIEALVEETNARESKNTDEPKIRGKESMTPEMENEEHTENMYGKEETDVETPIDFLQVKPEDIKQHDPSPDKNKSIEEEISNADPLGISTDKAERESVDVAHTHEENVETKDVAKDIPDSDKKDSIPIEEFSSQNPMNEASAGNANGEKSTKTTEESLITKEEPLESLQVADKDIETPPVCRDRDTSSLHEESPTTNPETIMDDNKEKMLYNAKGEEDETSKDKDIVEDISDCGKDDNMLAEELGSQNPHNGASVGNANIEESTKIGKGGLINEEASVESLQEAAQEIETDHLSRVREISSPYEQSHIVNLEGNRDDSKVEIAASETTLEGETLKDKQSTANTTPYEDKEESMQVQEDCLQWEQNESENIPSSEAPALSSIESSPVKEEEKVEIPTKEQILTADPQETIDETQEKTIDAADKNNDVAISAQNGDSDDNSPVEVDGLQEPPSEEVPAEKINDDETTTSHETKFAYENTVKANLNEDETKIECALVKEDVHIESSQVADDDIKGTSSGHDREANPLEEQAPTTGSQETMDDEEYAKPLDPTDLKQEILEDGKCATTPDEDTKEDSQNQADDFIMESEEQSVKDSESTSVSDTPKDDITESMLVKEVAQVEDPIDSSQVATEDIKAFAPRQDAESSIVEQIIDPTTVQNETPKDENVPTIVPDENTEEHLDEENEQVSSIKEPSGAELYEKDENSESALLMEEVQSEIPAENIKTSDFDQHTKEKGILEEKIPTENSQRIPSDEEEETRIDAATTNEKTQELQNDLNENSDKDLLLKVAASEMTHDINLEEEPERPSLTEISKKEAFENESILLEPKISDEPSTVEFPKDEKSTDYTTPKKENLQPEDHKTSTSSGDREKSCSLEEQSLEDNSQTIISDKITDAGEADKNDLALEVPKETDSVDVKEETKEEEGYIKAVEMTNAVTVASNQMTSNEHVSDSTSMESVVLEKINDPIVGEANSFGDKTDLEKIEVLNDGPTAIPISETLAETASRECTETEDQLPNVEKEAEVSKREAENDQKHMKETLPNDAVSVDVSESKEVTGEEEVSSNSCKEISSSPISVASEVVSTSNMALEEDSTSNSATDLETKNEEEVPAIKEKTPSSVEGQDAESTIVEKNSNYACSLTEKRSDSTEVAFMAGENKSGYESDKRSLESIAQGQSFNIMSETVETKAEEEDLNTESGIQSDKGVIEDILQEETMSEKEIVKDDISSEKEQLPRIKEEHEDVKDYHQDSCELEVSEVSEEADDKAPEDLQEKTITNKAIDRILHQEEQATSIEEPTAKIDDENVRDLDIGVNTDTQDSNKETVQIAIIPGKESEEQNKEDEICSSDKVQEVDEETLILSEGKSKEKAKEIYKEAYLEAEKFDSSPQIKDSSECAVRDVGPDTPEDNEKSTTGIFSEEDYPKNITKCEVSSASEDVALTEQPSEDASITAELQEAKKIGESTEGTPLGTEEQLVKDTALAEQPSEDACITAEVQEAKAGIDLGAAVPVPGATGSESQEVENLNDKCTEMADTSTSVETLANSTSKNIGESTEGTPLEAEDQQTELHDLPEESNMSVTEVKIAEKDDAVNIQSVRSISEDVQDQELFKESYAVSSNHNPVVGDPEERTEASEGQKTNPIQAAPVLETLKKEIEEQKLGRDNVDVHEEEKNTYSIPSQLESLNGADTEKVPESSIHQSLVEDTAQYEKKEGIQQIDSPLFLPHAQCSDIITSENEPAHVGGLGSTGVTELDASPLSLKDRHVVLEAGDTRNLSPENLDGDKNISTEHFQGEHEVVKPSKVEQEEDECGNKERKDQQMERKTESEETAKASLSDQLHVSARGTSEMADHSPTEKEPTRHTEDMPAQNIDEAQHENMKTDEEKDDEEESHEQKKSDLGSEAPVMVDIGDADIKVAHKKSHNILSGVGSKVKHSIAKVKKAIIGKSPSPKKATIPERFSLAS